jgi:hypothetical protein
MCWLRRDCERYGPERVDATVRHVTVSERVVGFAGRDLVILDDPARIDARAAELLPEGSVVLADRTGSDAGKEAEGNAGSIRMPADALTSRVCRTDGVGEPGLAVLRGLGYVPLSDPEAAAVFGAVAAFERRWAALREEGHSDAAVLGSLQRFGFVTRELKRRKAVTSRLKRVEDTLARELVAAVTGAIPSGAGSPDVIDHALVEELGFPIHRGSPARGMER